MSTALVVPVLTSIVGNIISNALTPIQNINKLDPLALRASAEYGAPISQAYGLCKIEGLNFFWGPDLIQTTRKGGKGIGARTKNFVYYMYGAWMIGGPVATIMKVWMNSIQVFDGTRVYPVSFLAGLDNFLFGNGSSPLDVLAGTAANADQKSAFFSRHAEFYYGTLDQPISSTIASFEGMDIPAFRGRSYIVMNNYPIQQFNGGGFPKVDVLVYGKGGVNPQVRYIITDIFASAGFDTSLLDLSQIDPDLKIYGGILFQRTGETFADYINEVCRIFFLVHRQEGHTFILLPKNQQNNITAYFQLADLGARTNQNKVGDLFKEKVLHKRELPSEVQVSFRNLGWNYQQWVVTSGDPLAQSKNPLSIQTRLFSDPHSMMGFANRLMGEVTTQRNTFSGITLLPCWYKKLKIADVISLDIGSRQALIQISKLTLTADYLVQVEGNQYLGPLTGNYQAYYVWVAAPFAFNWPALNPPGTPQSGILGGQIFYFRTKAAFVGNVNNAYVQGATVVRGDGVAIDLTTPYFGNSASIYPKELLPLNSTYQALNLTPVFPVDPSTLISDPSAYIANPSALLPAPGIAEGPAPGLINWDGAYIAYIVQITDPSVTAIGPSGAPYNLSDNQFYTISQVDTNRQPIVTPVSAQMVPYTAGNLFVLDIPLVKDSDNYLGFYLAVQNVTNFQSGWVWISTDNGASYNPAVQILASTPIGYLNSTAIVNGNSVLNAHNALGVIDRYTTFDVYSPTTIDPVTDDQFLSGFNLVLVGDEIMAFRDVTVVQPNLYRLSHLIRGVRGTENKTTSHVLGERVVLLNNLTQVPGDLKYYNQTLDFKLVPYDQLETNITAVETLTWTAQSSRPYTPCQVVQTKDPDTQDITLKWYRRTYQNGGMLDHVDISLATGELDNFIVEVWCLFAPYISSATSFVSSHPVNNAETFSYTAAMATTDNNGRTLVRREFKIYQVSTIVGRGDPVVVTSL